MMWPGERGETAVRMYRDGRTLQEIGDHFGVTRERIRQVLRSHSVERYEGGSKLRSTRKLARKRMERNQRIKDQEGCSFETFLKITQAHPKARRRFKHQRANARHRGIPFELTFYEWWTIWEQSGHYEDCGIGYGKWCMARFGDAGPYAVGNVKIIPAVINNIEYQEHKNGKRYHETRARVLDSIMDAV